MASKSDQLLVVSILQGRGFPRSPRLQLLIQASFSGELLDTDPVEHQKQPLFNNQLAWELNRKTLHQHRLQRTPIKLRCFAVDSVSKNRESVGYIVLELRSIQEVEQEPRWYPLLASKYTKHKPAILLSLVLEDDTKPRPPSPHPFNAEEAPPHSLPDAAAEGGAPSVSVPAPKAAVHPNGPPSPSPPPSSPTESEAESVLHEFHHDKNKIKVADVEVPAPPHSQPDAAAPSDSVPAVPPGSHRFSFVLNFCTLRNLSLSHPIAASLRYSYPFFGSAASITTSPAVEVQTNMEVSLPQSRSSFHFATLPHQLQESFSRVPLVVELWHGDVPSREKLIGRASIQLSLLLSSERGRFPGSTEEQGWRQSVQQQIAVVGAQCPNQKVADLSYTATLQDLGLVNPRDVVSSDSSQKNPPDHMQPPDPPADSEPVVGELPKAPLVPLCSSLEYQTAMELELWKKEQEDLFDDQLKKKEWSHLQALAEEYRRRDAKREALSTKKEMEYNLLEEQLQKMLADLEKKEKRLAAAELETKRLQRELQAGHDLAQKDLQESSRRLRQECDHQVAMEKDRAHLMEEERARLLQQIAEGEARYKKLEKEFSLHKEQQNIRPEFKLQAEINLLTLEKVELERKLDFSTKSKLHYKQQWGRALKELAHFKQREQENARTLLMKQKEELEAMKLRYVATEEEAVQQNRMELESIRHDLQRLKQQSCTKPTHSVSDPDPGPVLSENAEEHLGRLLEERDTLLRTGVYTHQDRLIVELNRHIQDAIRDGGAAVTPFDTNGS